RAFGRSLAGPESCSMVPGFARRRKPAATTCLRVAVAAAASWALTAVTSGVVTGWTLPHSLHSLHSHRSGSLGIAGLQGRSAASRLSKVVRFAAKLEDAPEVGLASADAIRGLAGEAIKAFPNTPAPGDFLSSGVFIIIIPFVIGVFLVYLFAVFKPDVVLSDDQMIELTRLERANEMKRRGAQNDPEDRNEDSNKNRSYRRSKSLKDLRRSKSAAQEMNESNKTNI
ncbi:unnamed protein product, partial [Polarella glacialis]